MCSIYTCSAACLLCLLVRRFWIQLRTIYGMDRETFTLFGNMGGMPDPRTYGATRVSGLCL